MNLWHDDIRRPPSDEWDFWARTNTQACQHLIGRKVVKISLDHDLGLDEDDPDAPGAVNMIGRGTETGRHLARWMVMNDLVPDEVEVHSMNKDGRVWLADYIRNAAKHGAISNSPKVTEKPFGIG